MISVLLYSHEKRELTLFSKTGREVVGKISADDWQFYGYRDCETIYRFLSEHPLIDISCVDVAAMDGIRLAEHLRKQNREMFMVLLADMSVSPMDYIRPTIMAGSLLMRPVCAENVKRVFTEAAGAYIQKMQQDAESLLMIENRDGKQPVPYSGIMFFESREKKIYVNTGKTEYAFYDTLDNLEQKLPEGFLRCHRSFIVAKKRIKAIMLSRSTIVLDDGSELPLSRSYKHIFKELK